MMKFAKVAFGLLACTALAVPAHAANSATAVACVEDNNSERITSHFLSTGAGVIWTGGVVRPDLDGSGVGVRIDTQTGSGAFRLRASSSEFADPDMFYIYGAGRGAQFYSQSGINVSWDLHGNSLWSFNGVPRGYKMVSIYFADFGEYADDDFSDTVYPPAVTGGGPRPTRPNYVSDCNIEYID
jgi:hypothetical protein